MFDRVSISFDDRPVLEDVSFSVERGETLCILGRSGVGKSVSLRMLMGFLKPDSGSIHVEGQEITGLGEEGMRAIRKRVTMVFQNGALFDSLSVRENVAFPLRERGGLADDQVDQIVDRLIGLVGAEDVADVLPASLSTGRKRAVAMARALAAQPEVVLYDEPTTMVDPTHCPPTWADLFSASSINSALPALWSRTILVSPASWLTRFSFCTRVERSSSALSRRFSHPQILISSCSWPWMPTYHPRNKDVIVFVTTLR